MFWGEEINIYDHVHIFVILYTLKGTIILIAWPPFSEEGCETLLSFPQIDNAIVCLLRFVQCVTLLVITQPKKFRCLKFEWMKQYNLNLKDIYILLHQWFSETHPIHIKLSILWHKLKCYLYWNSNRNIKYKIKIHRCGLWLHNLLIAIF